MNAHDAGQPEFLPEKRWFLAVWIFLAIAAVSVGIRHWNQSELDRLFRSRGLTTGPGYSVSYGRPFTPGETRAVQLHQASSIIGAVGVVAGVLGVILSAIGFWVMRTANLERMSRWQIGRPDADG